MKLKTLYRGTPVLLLVMVNTANFSIPDLNSNPLTNTGDVVRNAANAATDLVCDLYQNQPGWLTQVPDPTGLGGAVSGFYDSLCRPRGKEPPPVPPPPFEGGQCAGVDYRVSYAGTHSGSVPFNGTVVMRGPIGGTSTPPSRGGGDNRFDAVIQGGISPDNPTGQFVALQGSLGEPTFSITNVLRLDGGSDNCGSPPGGYPTTPPPPGALDRPAPINITPDVSVEVPVTFVLPPVDVNINPTVIPVFVRVGPFNVSIGLGGVSVNFAPEFNLPTRPDPRPDPPRLPPGGTDEADGCVEVLRRLDQKYNVLLDCDRCEQEKTYKSIQFGPAQSRTAALPPRCFAVAIAITQVPANKRVQFGDNAPDVLYAGWGWWGRAPFYEDRQAIDSEGKLFVWKRQDDILPDTFAYTLYQGFEATMQAFYFDLPEG